MKDHYQLKLSSIILEKFINYTLKSRTERHNQFKKTTKEKSRVGRTEDRRRDFSYKEDCSKKKYSPFLIKNIWERKPLKKPKNTQKQNI